MSTWTVGSGGVAHVNITKNTSYVVSKDVTTSFASDTEEDKEKMDHTYEVLPFEANEESQEDTTDGGLQGDAADGGQGDATDGGQGDDTDSQQEDTADSGHVYPNQ